MEIDEMMSKRGEGLKKLGAIFWLLNKIETRLITCITICLTDPSSQKTIILNRALFDEKVFPSLENKRQLFLRIINGYYQYSRQDKRKRNWPFNKNKYLEISKLLEQAQKVRNKLAHNFLSFSESGHEATYINAKNIETMEKITIDLDKELKKLQTLSEKFNESTDELLRETDI